MAEQLRLFPQGLARLTALVDEASALDRQDLLDRTGLHLDRARAAHDRNRLVSLALDRAIAEAIEWVATTLGDHSVFQGPEPLVEKCQDEKAEVRAIVAWVQLLMHDHGFATHEIGVTPYKAAIRTELMSADIATHELRPHEEAPGPDEAGVRMGSMKRIKGLEFRAVARVCAGPKDPLNDLEQAELRARCERYVAAIRAREQLMVTVCPPKTATPKTATQ